MPVGERANEKHYVIIQVLCVLSISVYTLYILIAHDVFFVMSAGVLFVDVDKKSNKEFTM